MSTFEQITSKNAQYKGEETLLEVARFSIQRTETQLERSKKELDVLCRRQKDGFALRQAALARQENGTAGREIAQVVTAGA